MAAGLFGKLPAKRDFIEHAVERAVMEKWDPWLQSAVATSRQMLGGDWLQRYLHAPIWRFWLGPGICGRCVLGALMPSVDGVGRYFPLSLVWAADGFVAPPEYDEQAAWFDAVEQVLLGALADEARYEDVLAALRALPAPKAPAPEAEPGDSVAAMFREFARARAAETHAGLSCWWVPSHDDGATPPRALMRRGLPAPEDYTAMIATVPGDRALLAVGEA